MEKPPLQPESPPSQETLKQYLRSLGPLIDIFSGASGLRVKIIDDPRLATAAFDASTRELIFNPNFFEKELRPHFPEERDLRETSTYITAHELTHLLQLEEDPKAYMRAFELPNEWTKDVTSPDAREKVKFIWQQYFNTAYDLNDIGKLDHHLIPYQPRRGSASHIPHNLYKKVLFPNSGENLNEPPDYSKDSLALQFLNVLLRKKMVPEEDAIVDKRVTEVLERQVQYQGEYVSIKDFIHQEFTYHGTKASDINHLTEKYTKSVLEELIKIDAEEGRLDSIDIKEANILERGKPSKEDIEKMGEIFVDKKKSNKERQGDLRDTLFKKGLGEAGFNEKEQDTLLEIEKSTREVIQDVKEIWKRFVRKEYIEETVETTRHKFGSSVDPSLIGPQAATILEDPEQSKIMRRYEPETKEVIKPKAIKLIWLPDLSGSMGEDERRAVQEACYAGSKSLYLFRDEMAVNSEKGESPLQVETAMIGFGSQTSVLPHEREIKEENTRLNRSVLDIGAVDLGGTRNADALRKARDMFTANDLEKIKAGELLAIVIEITDGETETENESIGLVDELNAKGIFTKGIKIPGFNIINEKTNKPYTPEELEQVKSLQGTFERVYRQHGMMLAALKQLKSVLLKLLAKAEAKK